jgi:type IV pilus assembly protein PilC
MTTRRKRIVTAFYQQLSILLEAGYSLMRALDVLASRDSNRAFKAAITRAAENIRKGSTFWEALDKERAYFPALHVQMLRAGEYSGNVPTILHRLSETGMREIGIINRVRATLAYPCIVLVVAVGLIAMLSYLLVPTFIAIFADNSIPVPGQLQLLVSMSNLVQHHWLMLLLGAVALVLLVRMLLAMPPVRYALDLVRLRYAAFGPLTKEYVVVHTCLTLSMLLEAGIGLLRALELTRDSAFNKVVFRGLEQARQEITAGRDLEVPLRRARIFPPLVVDMIATAQETGTLDQNLNRAARIFENQLDDKMRLLSSITEPLIVLVVGAVVFFVATSMFVPYIQLITRLDM